MIDRKEKNSLKKHSIHHTAKHMSTMKKGVTFKKSHNQAMKKVGR